MNKDKLEGMKLTGEELKELEKLAEECVNEIIIDHAGMYNELKTKEQIQKFIVKQFADFVVKACIKKIIEQSEDITPEDYE